MDLNIKIQNIKCIKNLEISFPLESGIYAITGENEMCIRDSFSSIIFSTIILAKSSSTKMTKSFPYPSSLYRFLVAYAG